jgi:hypothetical protein
MEMPGCMKMTGCMKMPMCMNKPRRVGHYQNNGSMDDPRGYTVWVCEEELPPTSDPDREAWESLMEFPKGEKDVSR